MMTHASKTHARTYKQACKDAYKQRKPMGAQASKGSILSHRVKKRVCIEQTGITEMHLTSGYTQTKPHGVWM